jgi:hypothetical protein
VFNKVKVLFMERSSLAIVDINSLVVENDEELELEP